MPILPLPEGTVRQLGSSVAVVSPVRLLKELLDNAIDSGATSIEVLISANTVDKLEVRDNGHGISSEDFDHLGRSGHTSKLKSFEELGTVGGTSLGFRGAALASANTLGDVSLTTRVSSEPVATVISLAKEGGVGKQRHVAAPAGTTVTVTGLFSHFPVRLQVAVREAHKNLAKIKELLQAYVLTRPSLKLRFAVLKAPNVSWSYAPSPNPCVKEAAMQLFGTDHVSQCTFEVSPRGCSPKGDGFSDTEYDSTSPSQPGAGPIFEALLPKPGADPQKITKGAFFSVDGRPLSPARGTAKRLLSVFRRRLGDHFAPDTCRDVFIRLNIQCPPGSYDVNVEPSKDDVLFRDAQEIINQFESFLSCIYAPPGRLGSTRSPTITTAGQEDARIAQSSQGLDLCLPPQVTVPTWRVDMSLGLDGMSDDENDDGGGHGPRQQSGEEILPTPEDEGNEASDARYLNEGLNPWSIAKLTGVVRGVNHVPEEPVPEQRQNQSRPSERRQGNEFDESLPEPAQRPRQAEPLEPHLRRQDRLRNPASHGRPLRNIVGHAPRKVPARSTRPQNWHDQSRRGQGLRSLPTSSPHENDYDEAIRRARPRTQYSASPGHLVQSEISFGRNGRRRRDHSQFDLDLDQQPSGTFRPSRRTGGSATRLDIDEVELVSVRGRAQQLDTVPETSPSHEPLPRLHMLSDDPRAQLIKQQCLATHEPQNKPRRLKTERLPLETIPPDSQTRALLLTVEAGACDLAQMLSGASRFDTWLADGKLRGAFKDGTDPNLTDPEYATTLIKTLLERIGQASVAAG